MEPAGWRYLTACDSTFPSANGTFSCRVMSHPKCGSGREQNLSTKIPSVGRAVFALPTEGSLLFPSLKVLRILKGLFQKVP